MKKITLVLSLFISLTALSQKQTKLQHIEIGGGYSFHGTGDMKGVAFFTEYGKTINQRTEWAINILATIHGDAFTVKINYQDGSIVDRSFRYNNAGLQIGPKFNYLLLNSKHSKIKIQAGGIVRYQNSTLPDTYAFNINVTGGIPQPNFEFYHSSKQNTITAGYSVDFSYRYITSKKLLFGIKAGLQNDTQGDLITQITLFTGRSFK